MEENVPLVRLWLSCQTQWRMGFVGATGLDYNAMFQVAGALGMHLDAKALRKVNVLEGMTLEYWRVERDKKTKNKTRKP